MTSPTADLRIRATKPLLAPAILEEEIPLDATRAALRRFPNGTTCRTSMPLT